MKRFCLFGLLLLAGCEVSRPVPEDSRAAPSAPDAPVSQVFLSEPELNAVIVTSPEQTEVEMRRALYQASLLRRFATRLNRVQEEQLAMLQEDVDGLAFLASESPRALVQGYPAAECPVRAFSAADTPEAAITNAVTVCQEKLAQDYADADCACALLAHDDILHAPVGAFAYAHSVRTRVFDNGALSPLPYLASEAVTPTGTRGMLLYVGDQVAGRVLYPDVDTAVMEFPDGRQFAGQRLVTGIQRGRYVEVLDMRDIDTGKQMTVLING